jgi:transposase-like protein
MRLQKIVKNRGHFPSDEAATKLLFLALRNIEKDWNKAAAHLEGGCQPIRHHVR